MKHVFFRCNSGHYFTDEYCPWDGWTHPEFRAISGALKSNAGGTIADLLQAGVSRAAIQRVLLIEFGDPGSSFQGIAPEALWVEGQVQSSGSLAKKFR